MSQALKVMPSPQSGYVLSQTGELMKVPDDWKLLQPGDAALSRRIKKDGPSWTIQEKKGNKIFSQGILAPAHRIDTLKSILAKERQDPSYQKRLDASRARRERDEQLYRKEFEQAVFHFLHFHYDFEDLAIDLSLRITTHAIPVGSGTVARTKTIPLEQRAEAATIAWLRHQTTAYDQMSIPREKGKRREVRQMLAKKSREILDLYRQGQTKQLPECPLYKALH